MSEKFFSVESAETKEPPKYKAQIISIINDIEKKIRYVDPEHNKDFFEAVHHHKNMDARAEKIEYEPLRKDVCESFGVPNDEDHVIILDAHKGQLASSVKQRAFRCFYVLIQSQTGDSYYAEGRTIHHVLLNKIISKIRSKDPSISEDDIFAKIDTEPPEIMVFKGFLSTDNFAELDGNYRVSQEQSLYNADGEKIETASGWFISGHNLPTEPDKH